MRPTPLILALTLLGASALHAQEPLPIVGYGGAELLFAYPVGEFEENVGFGFGIGAFGRLPLNESHSVSLRLDVGFLNYGNETIRICVTQPCRVTGDLTTSNNIFLLGLGPEVGVGAGPIRLYGVGTVGLAYFATTSSVEGSNNVGEPFASSTNFDDLTFAWTAGPGLQLRLSEGRIPVSLDLAARYHGNGEARYLRKGDITDEPDGSVVLNPRQSETNLWTFRLGVSLAFPPESERDRR